MMIMNDNQFLFAFIMFLSFFTLLYALDIPVGYTFVEPFDIFIVASTIVAITTACVVTTGLLCAPAVVGFGVFDAYYFLAVSNELVKIIIFTPIIILFLFVIFKLARGTSS